MFGTSSFLYFFQLLNNWPRFAVFVWENTVLPVHQPIEIDVRRPRVIGKAPYIAGFANSVEDIQSNYGKVYLSACSYWPEGNDTFTWEITKSGGLYRRVTGTSCQTTFHATKQETYSVSLLVQNSDNVILAAGQRDVHVRDVWVVAIGDSFSSGEGNPDTEIKGNRRALWISDVCHRSSNSWAFRVYEKIADSHPESAVHFSFLSCTGASVDSGILSTNDNRLSQLDVVSTIAKVKGISPDVFMMSVGGNDIGYSDILNSLVFGDAQNMFNSIEMRFFFVANQIDKLAAKVRNISPKSVIFPHYFDISRNQDGNIDNNCDELRQISITNLEHAEKFIFQRLNKLISRKCFEHGWTAVEETSDIFRTRGFCSQKSLIRTLNDSIRLQGSSMGAFHPVNEGHELVANAVWRKIEN